MERSLHRALLRFATLASLWTAAGAHAQALEPLALQWNAPAACPNKGQVLERIRTLAVEWPPRGAPLTAAATIARLSDGRFHLKLVVQTGDLVGQRELDAATCESLANAAAVHVALLLNGEDPNQAAQGGGGNAGPRVPGGSNARGTEAARSGPDAAAAPTMGGATGNAPPATANAPEAATGEAAEDTGSATEAESSESTDSAAPVRVLVQAPRASLQVGPLPRPSFGVSLAGGLMLQHWRLIAAAHVWLQQAIARDDQPSIRADVDRVSASLRLCRAAAWNRFELAPCAKLSLEHVWARGAGPDVTSRTAEATWVAAGLGVQSRLYLLAWWTVVADLDLELEAARPEISIDGLGRVGKLGLTAFTLTLGSEWIL